MKETSHNDSETSSMGNDPNHLLSSLKSVYQKIWELAQPYLNTRENDIHTEISLMFALRLLDAEGGDEDVVVPAIILHDVGWKQVPEDIQMKAFGPHATLPEWNRVHEVEGVRIAKEILQAVNYDPKASEQILDIIEGHDSRKQPLSLNDKLVKDADKLWRYTELGVEINRKRYDYTVDQYMHRLRSNLDPWFLTDSARKMAIDEMAKHA